MLTINKTLATQNLICTISEKAMTAGNVPILKVENKGTNVDYTYTLPANSSAYQNRYDQFTFPTTDISDWEEGQYLYTIWESEPSTGALIQELELGLLQVIGTTDEVDYIEVTPTETEDDYLVYDPNI